MNPFCGPRTILRAGLCCIFIITLILLAGGKARAIDFQGNLFTELYGYKQLDSTHIRPYAGMRGDLGLWRKGNRALELSTYFRYTTDFKSKYATDPQVFFYDAYLHLANVPARSELFIGRQFVYNSAGSDLIDGARVKYKVIRQVQIEMFGGSRVYSYDPEKIQSFSKFRVFGGRIFAHPANGTNVGLHLLSRRADKESAFDRAAFDIEQVVSQWRFYGRGAYDFYRKKPAELLARLAFQPRKWYFEGEYYMRQPSVANNTLFSIIDYYSYHQYRFNARRTIVRGVAFDAQMTGTIFNDGHAYIYRVGFIGAWYSFGWHHQNGHAGDNDGVHATVSKRLNSDWDIYGGANIGRYKVQVEQIDRMDAYSVQGGLVWRPISGFYARVEGQYLRNAIMRYQTRIFLRLSKDISWPRKNGTGR